MKGNFCSLADRLTTFLNAQKMGRAMMRDRMGGRGGRLRLNRFLHHSLDLFIALRSSLTLSPPIEISSSPVIPSTLDSSDQSSYHDAIPSLDRFGACTGGRCKRSGGRCESGNMLDRNEYRSSCVSPSHLRVHLVDLHLSTSTITTGMRSSWRSAGTQTDRA